MSRVKKFLGFMLVFAAVIFVYNTKSFAAEVQYTDNVIPVMTSDTSPSGKAASDSVWDNNHPAWEAFDHDTTSTTSAWASKQSSKKGWLSYEFNEKKCIAKYTVTPRNIADRITQSPKNWTFEALDETTGEWIVLDTQTNVTDWKAGVKKEFEITNNLKYNAYRINVTANNSGSDLVIGELEMMETVSAPTNLTAIAGNENIQLTWDRVQNAKTYNIKRSTVSGGEYVTFATVVSGSALTCIDSDVENGTTYYYVVTAVVSGTESANSNEASATLIATTIPSDSDYLGNRAKLLITMVTGEIKEYDLAIDKINDFTDWYDARYEGTGKNYFTISKSSSPYLSRKEYIVFDKISSFEIMDYNE